MAAIPESVVALLAESPLGHLVTINPDGSPQVTVVWVGVEDGELVVGSYGGRRKHRNVERDPRVAVSFEGSRSNAVGMREYLVVHGHARVTEGGGAALLERLSRTYITTGETFPPMPDPPDGYVLRIAPGALRRPGAVGVRVVFEHTFD